MTFKELSHGGNYQLIVSSFVTCIITFLWENFKWWQFSIAQFYMTHERGIKKQWEQTLTDYTC